MWEYWLSEENRLKAKVELDSRKAQLDFLRKPGPREQQIQVISEKPTIPLTSLLEKWEELITSLSQTTFQSAPPSKEELAAIIRVFGDSELCFNSIQMHKAHHLISAHRGHWFTCPNGHIFSIGICGGAMQTSRCNEYGEAIGGGDHTLLSTNRRDTLMKSNKAKHSLCGHGGRELERHAQTLVAM
jgi:hypothetical protein